MADFKKANARTGKWEGGYSNHPNDKGGETVFGISRNMHPQWTGWVIVDMLKEKPDFPANLRRHKTLITLKDKFYKHTFWDALFCDNIPAQVVAEEFYDDAVNTGISSAIKKAERIFNLTIKGYMTNELRTKLRLLR